MQDEICAVRRWFAAAMLLCAGMASAQSGRSYGPDRVWWDAGRDDVLPWEESYDNPNGLLTIVNSGGAVHTRDHAFFAPLGNNGRACVTCHQPSNAMSVSVASLRERWDQTHGKDPVFAAVDGSNCPDLPQTLQDSHSLLLNRGLFRIALPWPPRGRDGTPIQPDFRIEVVRDPTGCNTSPVYGLSSAHPAISVYRRPRVAGNLKQLLPTALMADAREPSAQEQAITAAMVHEQAPMPSAAQLNQIVEFESQLFVAQSADIRGGLLNEKDGPAMLGPQNLAAGKAVRPDSLAAWRTTNDDGKPDVQRDFRASVARGSDVFCRRSFRIRGVDNTCATCHAAGITRWMDIGTANRTPGTASPDLPLFRVTCDSTAAPHPFRGQVIYTHDPGRALISAKCADTGAIVMQQFHGLAARAPYFSNGSARSLREVIDFYEQGFDIRYTEQEKQDLVNFLSVL